jgi:glutamate racemase
MQPAERIGTPVAGPIGVFDSGVGGLSVWREIVRALPHEDTVYFADQAHMPYGPRSQGEIRAFCEAITRFLLAQGCKAIVVACNTASAAALKHLRETFPDVPSVGMEPAVKPAASLTRTGVVGIMATPATFQGRLFQATAGRHAAHIRLINQVCEGLADQVETGELDSPAMDALLHRFLDPMLAAQADVVVLACTHYPFVIEPIRRIVGTQVTVIDPAPAIARQVQRVLSERSALATRERAGAHRFFTSADPTRCAQLVRKLVGLEIEVTAARWGGGTTERQLTI